MLFSFMRCAWHVFMQHARGIVHLYIHFQLKAETAAVNIGLVNLK